MLFYNQIKREFSPTNWKRGQTHFREDHVRDVKMLEGSRISGRVLDQNQVYEITITMGRGTILKAECVQTVNPCRMQPEPNTLRRFVSGL